MAQEDILKKIIAHCKEYGFIFSSSEIYDGLSAVYDYGQNGVELKNNIKKYWWDSMTRLNENIVGIDADKLGHRAIAKGSPGYKPVVEVFGNFLPPGAIK